MDFTLAKYQQHSSTLPQSPMTHAIKNISILLLTIGICLSSKATILPQNGDTVYELSVRGLVTYSSDSVLIPTTGNLLTATFKFLDSTNDVYPSNTNDGRYNDSLFSAEFTFESQRGTVKVEADGGYVRSQTHPGGGFTIEANSSSSSIPHFPGYSLWVAEVFLWGGSTPRNETLASTVEDIDNQIFTQVDLDVLIWPSSLSRYYHVESHYTQTDLEYEIKKYEYQQVPDSLSLGLIGTTFVLLLTSAKRLKS